MARRTPTLQPRRPEKQNCGRETEKLETRGGGGIASRKRPFRGAAAQAAPGRCRKPAETMGLELENSRHHQHSVTSEDPMIGPDGAEDNLADEAKELELEKHLLESGTCGKAKVWQRRLWRFLDDPSSSWQVRVHASPASPARSAQVREQASCCLPASAHQCRTCSGQIPFGLHHVRDCRLGVELHLCIGKIHAILDQCWRRWGGMHGGLAGRRLSQAQHATGARPTEPGIVTPAHRILAHPSSRSAGQVTVKLWVAL